MKILLAKNNSAWGLKTDGNGNIFASHVVDFPDDVNDTNKFEFLTDQVFGGVDPRTQIETMPDIANVMIDGETIKFKIDINDYQGLTQQQALNKDFAMLRIDTLAKDEEGNPILDEEGNETFTYEYRFYSIYGSTTGSRNSNGVIIQYVGQRDIFFDFGLANMLNNDRDVIINRAHVDDVIKYSQDENGNIIWKANIGMDSLNSYGEEIDGFDESHFQPTYVQDIKVDYSDDIVYDESGSKAIAAYFTSDYSSYYFGGIKRESPWNDLSVNGNFINPKFVKIGDTNYIFATRELISVGIEVGLITLFPNCWEIDSIGNVIPSTRKEFALDRGYTWNINTQPKPSFDEHYIVSDNILYMNLTVYLSNESSENLNSGIFYALRSPRWDFDTLSLINNGLSLRDCKYKLIDGELWNLYKTSTLNNIQDIRKSDGSVIYNLTGLSTSAKNTVMDFSVKMNLESGLPSNILFQTSLQTINYIRGISTYKYNWGQFRFTQLDNIFWNEATSNFYLVGLNEGDKNLYVYYSYPSSSINILRFAPNGSLVNGGDIALSDENELFIVDPKRAISSERELNFKENIYPSSFFYIHSDNIPSEEEAIAFVNDKLNKNGFSIVYFQMKEQRLEIGGSEEYIDFDEPEKIKIDYKNTKIPNNYYSMILPNFNLLYDSSGSLINNMFSKIYDKIQASPNVYNIFIQPFAILEKGLTITVTYSLIEKDFFLNIDTTNLKTFKKVHGSYNKSGSSDNFEFDCLFKIEVNDWENTTTPFEIGTVNYDLNIDNEFNIYNIGKLYKSQYLRYFLKTSEDTKYSLINELISNITAVQLSYSWSFETYHTVYNIIDLSDEGGYYNNVYKYGNWTQEVSNPNFILTNDAYNEYLATNQDQLQQQARINKRNKTLSMIGTGISAATAATSLATGFIGAAANSIGYAKGPVAKNPAYNAANTIHSADMVNKGIQQAGISAAAGAFAIYKSGDAIKQQKAMLSDLKRTPNTLAGSQDDINMTLTKSDFSPVFIREELWPKLKEQVAMYLHMYGSNIGANFYKPLDFIQSKYHFNFFQAESIFENLKNEYALTDSARQILDMSVSSGITIWHYRSKDTFKGIKNFNVNNVDMNALAQIQEPESISEPLLINIKN